MAASTSIAHWSHSDPWTTHGSCGSADYGAEQRQAFSELPSGAESSGLVESGTEPIAVGDAGQNFCGSRAGSHGSG